MQKQLGHWLLLLSTDNQINPMMTNLSIENDACLEIKESGLTIFEKKSEEYSGNRLFD